MIETEKLYEGKVYKIYALNENKKCYIKDFIENLNKSTKKKVFALLERAANKGIPKNHEKFKKIEDKLYEFKSYQVRLFCTFENNKVILLISGFVKKSNKIPKREKERAKRLLKKYYEDRKDEN